MRIVVFGASSRAGLYIVKEALEREHRVAAFTRRPEAFPLGHHKLDVIGGDIRDAAAVSRALGGARGVICALEVSRRKAAAAVCSEGMENIVRGMEGAGCRRLIYLSSTETEQVGRLRASGLDWVLVRTPPGFREGTGPAPLRVCCDGSAAGKHVYLADLAAFLVEELEKGRYQEKLPMVFSA